MAGMTAIVPRLPVFLVFACLTSLTQGLESQSTKYLAVRTTQRFAQPKRTVLSRLGRNDVQSTATKAGNTRESTFHVNGGLFYQGYTSWLLAGCAMLTAALFARLRWQKPRHVDVSSENWMMANISVNPELLKRFGLPVRPEDIYPGLAESIIERKAPGGVPANIDDPAVEYSKADLESRLSASYHTFSLDAPGTRVHSIDPPVLTIEGFLSDASCEAFKDLAGPLLKPSTIGAGKLWASGTERSDRRTSTSVLVDESVLGTRPSLSSPTGELQSRAKALFGESPWDPTGRVPRPGSLCFEALQVARYDEGQYFMEHEDGFPLMTAKQNRFQRLATILVYLNDVPEGGETRFPYLDLAIRPKKGTAVVFFPGYRDGRPDDRTSHEACRAVNEKWVAQQWVAVGVAPMPEPSRTSAPAASAPATPAEASVEEQKKRMQSKLDAMAAHNEKAVEKHQQASKKKAKEAKKDALEKKLGPKRGFGG
jgi:hypothetical protein